MSDDEELSVLRQIAHNVLVFATNPKTLAEHIGESNAKSLAACLERWAFMEAQRLQHKMPTLPKICRACRRCSARIGVACHVADICSYCGYPQGTSDAI